jgi:SAM-dependent methyltransferase
MQERHSNIDAYFKEQEITTKKYVIPYVEQFIPINKDAKILEIGCGEAGNLKPFADIGCECLGVDLNRVKVEYGQAYYAQHPNGSRVTLVVDDVFNMVDAYKDYFDLVILRDVIEHIHNQEKFMKNLKNFVKPGGQIFFGFPPWQNPFGGHQQICKSKFLSVLPFFHLLPMPLYKLVLKAFGENKSTIDDLEEIKQTGISIERFERILKAESWVVSNKTFYFINPNYEIKFGLKPREAFGFIAAIPFVRNFFTTACYYSITKK